MSDQKNLRKTYELKEPTVNGLIEKLTEGNYINLSEADEVRTALAKATEKMNDLEVAYVINMLDKRIDAPGSEVITSAGFNYSSFEKTLQEATSKVQEQRDVRISKEKELDMFPEGLQDKMGEKHIDAAALEQGKEIVDNVIDICGQHGINLNIDDKTKEELTEATATVNVVSDSVNKLMQSGLEYEVALEQVLEDNNISKEYWKSDIVQAACAAIYLAGTDKVMAEKGVDSAEAEKEFLKNNPFIKKMLPELDSELLAGKTPLEKGVIMLGGLLEKHQSKKFKKSQDKVLNIINSDEYCNISDLRRAIFDRIDQRTVLYDRKNTLKYLLNQTKPKKQQEIENEFFEKMKNEYLSTDQTISDIYEKYKNTSKIAKLDFEDMVVGIQKKLYIDCKTQDDVLYINNLMYKEREIRGIDQTLYFYDYKEKNVTSENKGHYFSQTNLEKLNGYKDERKEKAQEINDAKVWMKAIYRKEETELRENIFDVDNQGEILAGNKLIAENMETGAWQIPNIGAIAEKFGVTNLKLRGMFSKIKNLWKSKNASKSTQEQENQQLQSVDDEEITQ